MKVWDLATRLYHWLQAVLFVGLMATGFSGNGPHVQFGLLLFTLLVWRIIWGVVGSETSRFKQFVRSPKSVILYLLGREPEKAGHNPAGGWMVIMMLSALLLQCVSGLALGGFFDELPYAQYWLTDELFSVFESMHLGLVNLLPALVGLHVAAILFYKLRSKPLTKAMITGVQAKLEGNSTVRFVSQLRALLVLVVSASVTMAIIAFSS
ncbi:hydrogenase [Vibrio aquaticus]|uniref:Hydrogenase n=1 Tax=Vibrio aquaticus TaxID=2496559 RepID=A0A432D244_9VIBR|nr:cytochrome b/b6 domain-containing protein [Vibrio aquaticus]RTZ17992.1 hydrogenase [Vibrio aquaticus]